MELIYIIFLTYFQVVTSQYYAVPATYPSYYNSYYPNTASSLSQSIATNIATNSQRKTLPSTAKLPKLPKRSVGNTTPNVKCSPQSASAYFLTTPTETIKATVITNENIKENISPVKYSCPLCNNFADVPRNSKLQPPPPVSPLLPGIIDTVPTITIPKNLTTKDPSAILAAKTSVAESPVMFEKQSKMAKKLSFDQELLDGFLTGLGIAV